MRLFFLLLSLSLFTSCIETKKNTKETTILTPFKTSSFNNKKNNKQLEVINKHSDFTLFSTEQKETAQEKTISHLKEFTIFLLEETNENYFVEIAIFGNKPQNTKGYVNKKKLQIKKENSLTNIDLPELEEGNFKESGKIKIITEKEYLKLKKNVSSNFYTINAQPQINSEGNYELPTNNDGTRYKISSRKEYIGFSNILQSFVFLNKDTNEFELWSKLTNKNNTKKFKSLPKYNTSNDLLFTFNFINTSSLKFYAINDELTPKLKHQWNFVNFKVIPNTYFWASDHGIITQIQSFTDENQQAYILIQFVKEL